MFTNNAAKYATVGEETSFTLDGVAEGAKVLVNGTEVAASNGVYTVKTSAETKIEVVADTTAPETTPVPGTTPAGTSTTGNDGGNNTVVIVVVVAVAVVALGVVAVIVTKKKKA